MKGVDFGVLIGLVIIFESQFEYLGLLSWFSRNIRFRLGFSINALVWRVVK